MLRSLFRRILGLVFIFSGFVKCVDPVGTSVFVEKYLATYHLEEFLPLALGLAVALAAVELMLGLMLLCGVAQRVTAVATTIFMSLFTVVTLLSATILPLGDCGCFGDAVRLSPWQTFAKNLVLLPMAIYVWWGSERRGLRGRDTLVASLSLVVALGINLYSLRYQPIIDFMPYRVGVNLWEAVSHDRLALDSSEQTHLVFRSIATGEELIFASDDVECWQREDIEFVESRQDVVSSSSFPFAEFVLTNAEGEDCTLSFLEQNRDITLITIYDLESLTDGRLRAVRELLHDTENVAVITSVDRGRIVELLGVEPYSLDAMTLRTLIRSRIGVVVLSDGAISRKCDIRDI